MAEEKRKATRTEKVTVKVETRKDTRRAEEFKKIPKAREIIELYHAEKKKPEEAREKPAEKRVEVRREGLLESVAKAFRRAPRLAKREEAAPKEERPKREEVKAAPREERREEKPVLPREERLPRREEYRVSWVARARQYKLTHRLYNVIERMLPGPVRKAYRDALDYAGVDWPVGKYTIVSSLLSLLVTIIVVYALVTFSQVYAILIILIASIIVFITALVAIYNVLLYYGQKRTLQIEEMLPDALQLISANLRADIPIHKSLLLASRPEFGLLAKELEKIGNDILTGKTTSEAFIYFARRVRSPLVNRVTALMAESLRSGHDLAGLLEQISIDIRSFKVLESEANANISTYVLFIVVAVVMAAPGLYAVSITFVDLSDGIREQLNVKQLVEEAGIRSQSNLVGIVASDRGISANDLAFFAGMNLMVSAIIAALVVSVLQTGDELQKLPLVPIFVIVSLLIFFVALTTMRTVLGGLFGLA